MIDLAWAKRFKEEYGVCPIAIQRKQDEEQKKSMQEWEEMIVAEEDNYAGDKSQGFHDIRINWDVIAREEANGYDWPTMPWLPLQSERVGKTWAQLNKIAFERREILQQKDQTN